MKQVGKSNWYVLSDGTKVQGKANAEKAEANLKPQAKVEAKPKSDVADVFDPEYGTVAKRQAAEAKEQAPTAKVATK